MASWLQKLTKRFGNSNSATNQTSSDLSQALLSLAQNMGSSMLESVDKNNIVKKLPADRMLRYPLFDQMEDSIISGQALDIHIQNALSYDEDSNSSIKIESRNNENNPVVKNLRDTFFEWLQLHDKQILRQVAKYGCYGVRPRFKKNGIDLDNTEVNEKGHPSTFRIFESGGKLAGYHSDHQDQTISPVLGQPWQFVVFKSPGRNLKTNQKVRVYNPADPAWEYDIWDDNPPPTIRESIDYGKSLFEKAYEPGQGLDQALLHLLIARLKSANRETYIGLPVGANYDPTQIASKVRELTDMFQQREDADRKKSIKDGLVQVARKLFIPFDSSGKGQLNFSHADPNINIEGINDLMLYVKIYCGSLGVDPALMGFSDMISGGWGDGGWFRTSIVANMFGISLRQGLRNGLERLFELHVYQRTGKIYTPSNKPWRTRFHAVSDAQEKETVASMSSRMDIAERFANLLMGLSESSPELKNVVLSNLMKMDETVIQDLTKAGNPSDETLEKSEKFKDMKDSEKAKFIEEDVVNSFLNYFNH